MTATAFYRCIHTSIIYFLVAILAQFMSRLLIAVDISIAYVLGMTVGAFINDHDIILGMMASGAGVGFLVLTMGKFGWFSCCFSLQSNFCRANADLNPKSTAGNKE